MNILGGLEYLSAKDTSTPAKISKNTFSVTPGHVDRLPIKVTPVYRTIKTNSS